MAMTNTGAFLAQALRVGLTPLSGSAEAACGTSRWLDLAPAILDPLIARLLSQALLDQLGDLLQAGPLSIGGVGHDGILLLPNLRETALEVAPQSPLSYFGVRTAHGAREPNRPLFGKLGRLSVLVCGVVMTGRTLATARQLAAHGGSEVVRCLIIVDRRDPPNPTPGETVLLSWNELQPGTASG